VKSDDAYDPFADGDDRDDDELLRCEYRAEYELEEPDLRRDLARD
jgi:hypothetical protein